MLHHDPLNGLEQRFNKSGFLGMGGGGGGGGGTTTQYVQSPEAQQVMEAMMPSIQRLGAAGGAGGTLWDIPQTPSYGAQPDYNMMMPSADWYSNISPEVMQGIRAPYQDASQQLAEQMGAGGMAGSARGGWSGAAGEGLGKFWEEAGRNMGQQAWGMTSPALQAGYGAEMDQWGRQAGMQDQAWQQDIMARQFPYTAIPGIFGASMPSPVVTQGGGGGKK